MAIKTIVDSVKGSYDVYVSAGPAAAGAVLPGSKAIVAGVVSASAGYNFLVSGSAMATTASLPFITVPLIGTRYIFVADKLAITVTASNPLTTPAGAWTTGIAAYGNAKFMAVSGALGCYWVAI